jgi:pseudouridine synthase
MKEPDAPQGIRLAKLMARRGVASRREAEELIAAGLVTVNGKVAEVVTFVDPERDVITLRGERLPDEPGLAYYVMYKPRGYITGREDPQGRRSVLDLVAHLPVRVEPVGRLDYDTEGVLLLTNDGPLAHELTHPSREIPKRYFVRVDGVPTKADVQAVCRGVPLDDGVTAPAQARLINSDGKYAWLEVIVTEGRNRLIRRVMKTLGYPVIELRRESFATVGIHGLKPGDVRPLTPEEVSDLQALATGPKPKRRVVSGL